MEKVKINIKYNSSKNVSLTFYVEKAKEAAKFFEVLSDSKIKDRVITTNKVEITEEEKDVIRITQRAKVLALLDKHYTGK